MARITDYASLSAAVIDHTTRDDLADSMDRFVQLAEQAMKRRLRSLDMETTAVLPITSGEVTLPADLLSIRSIHIDDDFDRPLVAADILASPGDLAARAGTYRRRGGKVSVSPVPTTAANVSLTYIAAFTPLAVGTTNWIIRDHPDVYFQGTLAQAFSHFRDMDAQVMAETAFRTALEEVARSRTLDRWGSGVIAPSLVQQVSGARC